MGKDDNSGSFVVDLVEDGDRIDPGSKTQWVHLFAHGRMRARDGRRFELTDAQGVIDRTLQLAGGVELPVDYEHQTDYARENGKPAPAAGWIKAFEVRENGIWAKVQWTDIAAQMIFTKEYRYISPTFKTPVGKPTVVVISRAALTNNPALELTALAKYGDEDEAAMENEELLLRIAKILGLSDDADGEDIESAISALVNGTDAIDGKQMAAVQELMMQLGQERTETRMARVTEKVRMANRSGALPPSMVGWMTRLCNQDEAAFDEFIAKVGTPFAYLFKGSGLSERAAPEMAEQTVMASSETRVADMLGIDVKDMRD